jgi:hypothetical protein
MNDLHHPARRPGGEWILAVLLAFALGALAATVGFACLSVPQLVDEKGSWELSPAPEQLP